jgi:Glyoxalase-like domain
MAFLHKKHLIHRTNHAESILMTFPLDHIVINTLFDMDRAATLMEQLGFTVTPRGYHSLGSINHLMVFEGGYLELVGLPLGTDVLRRDVLESPLGLNGLVFQAKEVDAIVGPLRDSGLAMLPPQDFSRPAIVDGVEQLVRFRTARTAPELFAAGRVYYCQHYTPELVWRREWMTHANGSGLRELVIVTNAIETDVSRYAKAAQAAAKQQESDVWTIDLVDSFRIILLSPTRYSERYGELCVEANDRNSFFGAIVLKTDDLSRIHDVAAPLPELRSKASDHSLALLAPFLNTLFEFRSDR